MTRMETKLVHLGRASASREQAVNPPLVRASTTLFDSIEALRTARAATPYEVPRYGLYGTSTTFELQAAMAELSGAETCLATASGLSAIAAVLSAHARPGGRILLQGEVYEPTRTFAERELPAGTEVVRFDTLEDLSAALDERAELVFLEAPTSNDLRLIDVREAARLAHHHGALVACDATWGTPLYFDAHGHGVDLAIHAATKYIGGHSDLMLGLITGDRRAVERTREWCMHHGSTAAPDVCWLGLRGLRTLAVRMARHQASALRVASWLEAQPAVAQVLYPALPSDPDHALWRELFSGAAGLFSFELRPCSDAVAASIVESLQLFGLGASWGGFESLVLPVQTAAQQGSADADHGRLVRLSIGLEDPDDLIADLDQALARW
jgi:cystathionine beta-lyase